MSTFYNYAEPSLPRLLTWRLRTIDCSSISLVGEGDRAMLKLAIKRSENDKVRHRLVPDEPVKAMVAKLEAVRDEVSEVLKEEQEEKAVSPRSVPFPIPLV